MMNDDKLNEQKKKTPPPPPPPPEHDPILPPPDFELQGPVRGISQKEHQYRPEPKPSTPKSLDHKNTDRGTGEHPNIREPKSLSE